MTSDDDNDYGDDDGDGGKFSDVIGVVVPQLFQVSEAQIWIIISIAAFYAHYLLK